MIAITWAEGSRKSGTEMLKQEQRRPGGGREATRDRDYDRRDYDRRDDYRRDYDRRDDDRSDYDRGREYDRRRDRSRTPSRSPSRRSEPAA